MTTPAPVDPPPADDERSRREQHAVQLLEKIIPYDSVGTEGRLRATHGELMYAIDRVIKEQKAKPTTQCARFNDAEIEVLRSITLQILYIIEQRITALDSKFEQQWQASRPKAGHFRRLWTEFMSLSPMAKWFIIGPMIVALVGGAYAVFHDYIFPPARERPTTSAPARTHEPPKLAPAPTPTPPGAKSN